MKLKNIICLVCLIIISLQLIACSSSVSSKADYDFYPNEESLTNASDIIIYGEVVKEDKAKKIDVNANKNRTKQQKEEDMITYTVFEVKVDQVMKGALKSGDIIKVKQLGDKDGILEKSIEDNGGYYKKGSKYIMFLASFENILPGTPYEALNPVQGQVEFIDGEAKANKNNKLFKEETKKDALISKISELVKKEEK